MGLWSLIVSILKALGLLADVVDQVEGAVIEERIKSAQEEARETHNTSKLEDLAGA